MQWQSVIDGAVSGLRFSRSRSAWKRLNLWLWFMKAWSSSNVFKFGVGWDFMLWFLLRGFFSCWIIDWYIVVVGKANFFCYVWIQRNTFVSMLLYSFRIEGHVIIGAQLSFFSFFMFSKAIGFVCENNALKLLSHDAVYMAN